ncbi:uncharacterized protein [Anabrus simplex]|uniref:uncharacterized protein n=1 Tax=Anabrus simplex TaxID=316456 RepID=UPI0035A26AA9
MEPYNMQDEMAKSDRISHKPYIEEDISRLIKKEPFNEEIWIKDDPDDVVSVKIEQDVTAMIVPKVERKASPSKSYEDFRSISNDVSLFPPQEVNKGVKNVFDNITGFLNNEFSKYDTTVSMNKHRIFSMAIVFQIIVEKTNKNVGAFCCTYTFQYQIVHLFAYDCKTSSNDNSFVMSCSKDMIVKPSSLG